jgi:LPXTG-motif cell wall-anchored protein
MNRVNMWNTRSLALGIGTISVAFAIGAMAQVQTDTSVSHGASTKQVQVERATVLVVEGDDLFVKMDDGTIRHFPSVPESARINVDGKELGIHDLKPGMTLRRTITTTTTPKVITTTQSVTGKVWYVQPPSTVILTLDDGTQQKFNIPKGQKFNINGQMVDAWGLKKGMMVSATKVVEEPVTVVEHQRQLTGNMPPPPPSPPADVPILVLVVRPMQAPPVAETASAEPAPAALPKTASELPLLGFMGAVSLLSGLGLRIRRRNF